MSTISTMSVVSAQNDSTNTCNVNFLNEVIEEIADSLTKEAVRHFLATRPRDYGDDSRFFYNKRELNAFYALFDSKGGDRDKIEELKILDDCGDFFCWEIRRNRGTVHN